MKAEIDVDGIKITAETIDEARFLQEWGFRNLKEEGLNCAGIHGKFTVDCSVEFD